MLNILEKYIPHSLPDWGNFSTSSGLTQKADPMGKLLPFYGNTTVFLLDEDTKEKLKNLQTELYNAAPDMLAEPLIADTFHLTLHDLANGPPNKWNLEVEMADMAWKAEKILALCRELPPIRMQATWMFNMVNTSIVLGMKPADAESGQRLDAMYSAMELVHPLGYALTPHITLAYYKPGCYEQDALSRLRTALHAVDLDITLLPAQLVLQNFWTMNHYKTVK